MRAGEWVEKHGIRGVRVEDIPIDFDTYPTFRHTTIGARRFTTHIAYDDPHPLR